MSSLQPASAMTREQALAIVAQYFKPQLSVQARNSSIVQWAHENYYIADTSDVINLLPFQQTLFNFFFDPANLFQTIVFSSIKKSGKTALAGMVGRWVAETWGHFNEVYCMANDEEQARGRIYEAIQESIELDPRYQRGKRAIPGVWRIIERNMKHDPSGSMIRAVSNDNRGEAGSNPTITLWSELWGLTHEKDIRFWEELTPVPTRPRSIRYVETYAGYEGESHILEGLYDTAVKHGTRLTHADLEPYGGWPYPDVPPVYVNPSARTVAYWDTGVQARRLPWQTEDYYAAQEALLRPMQFARLHLNEWTSSASTFVPIEWWDVLAEEIPPLDQRTPVVIAVDGSVKADCTALVIMSRDSRRPETDLLVRGCALWKPEKGHPLSYDLTLKPALESLCSTFNVVQVAYDAYQLHHLMSQLSKTHTVWCREFSQGKDRSEADKQLHDLIRDRRIHHNGDPDLREHVQNAAAKIPATEDTKLRIVKKSQNLKIDLTVCLSMAAEECLRLML